MNEIQNKIPAVRTTLKDLLCQKGIVAPDAETYLAKIRELEQENHNLREKNTALSEELKGLREQIHESQQPVFSPDILFQQAVFALKQDNLPDAMGFLRAVLIIEPQNIRAMNNLAVVYSELGYEDKAIEILQQVLAAEPENSTALKNLAILQQLS